MAKIKYYYDTETCRYEQIKLTKWDKFLNFMGFVSASLAFAIVLMILFGVWFDSPKEAMLKKENKELKYHYDILSEKINNTTEMLAYLEERDANIYRVIYEAEPLPNEIRQGGIGGSYRYADLLDKGMEKEELIIDTYKEIDELKKRLYVQTKSYDEILTLARNKEKLWASIPAIQPVSNSDLKRLASGFGYRIHPIHKIKRLHTGCDFSAPKGTPIYATGGGKVVKVKTDFSGYGKHVIIDHGYGYKTLYAHMQDFAVKRGEKVKRGDLIGYVGNTGSSTAPHVHYEVRKNDRPVNPINYLYQGITPAEYEELLRLASIENQSLS
ncbi:M23 family metallopeptidase [Persicobacter sp. CCB-QB2]|uniref:M23 family metallopeptidase n=1 Tax=Persicobacter sp. CCB-QB2 TaxID=1561025 RepID=UPI0006A9D235|nr:M23 family metallopeptidase [Persicobacter sp. CCB-QB2]